MPGTRATNKAMFWRIIRRLLGANRGRLFVMLLALGAGAAVTAALLNIKWTPSAASRPNFALLAQCPHHTQAVNSPTIRQRSKNPSCKR